ncbi:MAG: hypothetical protein NC302_11055 [Bacteroidales bacterium]|nr:hypothetical protein [Bacteroidales bacterium]MCM1415278.1 hypothetical protein [bacterium]MCM1424444.1 hypothetical protein [bacterium]
MPGNGNVAIDKNTAVSTMAALRSETEQFLSEMESGYRELSALFVKSEGEFITALKEQLQVEQEVVCAIGEFFLTLLEMMNAAEADFGKLDNDYAQEKIK